MQYVSNSTEFQVKDNSKTTQNKNAWREEWFGKFIIQLTKAEATKDFLKRMMCELCDKTFFCQQNPDEHTKNGNQ